MNGVEILSPEILDQEGKIYTVKERELMTYTIHCPNCGIVHNNKSELTCDHCGAHFYGIKSGDIWHVVDELEEDNPYT